MNEIYDNSKDLQKCIEVKEDMAESEVTTVQAVIVGGIILSAGASVLSMNSPGSMFSLFNQFQLLILLPMIPPYMPIKLKHFILGLDFALFSFDFVSIDSIPKIKELDSWISFPQKDTYINEIGINFQS